MSFVFQHVSNHGTRNPIVARLELQTAELLKSTQLDKPERDQIFSAAFEVADRLLKCWEIANWLEESLAELQKEATNDREGGAQHIPFVIDLPSNCENFLTNSKNAFRDILPVYNCLCGSNFDSASDLSNINKRPANVAVHARDHFGKGDRFYRFLDECQDRVARIVRYRNAIEHPGGKSGTLSIHNFRLVNGHVMRPSWHLDDNDPIDALYEMREIIMFSFHYVETFLVTLIDKNLDHKIFRIYEVPEEQRPPENPARYKVSLSPELASRLPSGTNGTPDCSD